MAEEADRLIKEVEEGVAADEDEEEEGEEGAELATAQKKKKGPAAPTASDEAVFAQSYIPRALDQVYDIERDVARVLRGEGEDLIYADITGVANIRKSEGQKGDAEGEGEGEEGASESGSGSEGESGSESEGEEGYKERQPRGKKHEDKDDKKVRYWCWLLLLWFWLLGATLVAHR